MKYNFKFYIIITMFILFGIIVKMPHANADSDLFGGGGLLGTKTYLNEGELIKYSCSVDEKYKRLIKVNNLSSGCTFETLDVFDSGTVILKVEAKKGEIIESNDYEYILYQNAVSKEIVSKTNIDIAPELKALSSKKIKCNDIKNSNSSILKINDCDNERQTIIVEGLAQGQSIITFNVSSVNYRVYVTVLNNLNREDDNQGGSIIGSDSNSNKSAEELCTGLLGPTLKKDLEGILKIIQILAPLIVVLLTTVEFIGAVASKDDDALKKGLNRLVTRLVLVAVLFFLPLILNYLLQIIDSKYSTCI